MATGVSLRRPLKDTDIVCPAGSRLGESCVYCGVEQTVIDAYLNVWTVEGFCTGDNERCPSWRAEKEALDAGKAGAVEAARDAAPRRNPVVAELAHRKARERIEVADERAVELLTGTSDEARRFQSRFERSTRHRGVANR